MSVARYLGDMAHGALLSAGHIVTTHLRSAIDRKAHTFPFGIVSEPGGPLSAVIDILETVGFRPDREVQSPHDLLPDITYEVRLTPNAGHVVRLLGEWSGLSARDTVVLSGARTFRTPGFTIAKGRHFWAGTDAEGVSQSSGGPGSILPLAKDRLRPTNDSADVWFWCWRRFQEANGGIDYRRRMPVWEWDPAQGGFFDPCSEEERTAA